jgi:hypothetical protein
MGNGRCQRSGGSYRSRVVDFSPDTLSGVGDSGRVPAPAALGHGIDQRQASPAVGVGGRFVEKREAGGVVPYFDAQPRPVGEQQAEANRWSLVVLT